LSNSIDISYSGGHFASYLYASGTTPTCTLTSNVSATLPVFYTPRHPQGSVPLVGQWKQ